MGLLCVAFKLIDCDSKLDESIKDSLKSRKQILYRCVTKKLNKRKQTLRFPFERFL